MASSANTGRPTTPSSRYRPTLASDAAHAQQRAAEQDAERLERDRHDRIARQIEADARSEDDQQRPDGDHQQVALPQGGALAEADRDEEVPEGEPALERRHAGQSSRYH